MKPRIKHIRSTKIDIFDKTKFWEAPLCEDLPGYRKTKTVLYADNLQEADCKACWNAKSNGVPINQQAARIKRDHPLRIVGDGEMKVIISNDETQPASQVQCFCSTCFWIDPTTEENLLMHNGQLKPKCPMCGHLDTTWGEKAKNE